MPYPVITVAQMREWEKATWASGETEAAVMRRAGAAVARGAERLTRAGEFILVVAGKGHNGDDARYAAEAIREREVRLLRVVDPELSSPELEMLLARHPALVIDGLFGIGLNRPLTLPWLRLIQLLNTAGRPVLAVDVPSGLNADTGLPLEDAIRARVTLTFGGAKAGLLKSTAWPFVGRLEVAPDIGLIPYPFTTELNVIAPEDFVDFPGARPQAGHKGTFGHLAIVAGSLGYHGAAVLAARGAQRAQPGLITLLTAPSTYEPVARQLQSVMVRPWDADMILPDSCTAVLIGPGLAAPDVPLYVKEFARHCWAESPLAVIVDASALDWLRPERCPEQALRVITPHPGEASRMLETTPPEVQNDRPQGLRELSRRFGQCHVVLKGHQTLIGRAKGELSVNCAGNPHLAQGGSGDLLSGYLGGLLAQPALQPCADKTLRHAVWQHAAAADALFATRPNFTIEELAEVLGLV